MIYENYCSFEVSKLLKEIGFNEPCLKDYWYSDKELHSLSYGHLSYHKNEDLNTYHQYNKCTAPTYGGVIDWLKEKYNIWTYCCPSNLKEFGEWKGGAYWIKESVPIIFNNSSHYVYSNEPSEVIEQILLYLLKNVIQGTENCCTDRKNLKEEDDDDDWIL